MVEVKRHYNGQDATNVHMRSMSFYSLPRQLPERFGCFGHTKPPISSASLNVSFHQERTLTNKRDGLVVAYSVEKLCSQWRPNLICV